MALTYTPADGAIPALPWNITYLSQRDVTTQIPIDHSIAPGVTLQAACFSEHRYEDTAAELCFSNLLAVGFRRIIIDAYWDSGRAQWSLCPVEIPSLTSGTITESIVSSTILGQGAASAGSNATVSSSSVLAVVTRAADDDSAAGSLVDVERRAAASSTTTSSQLSATTVTLNPTTTGNGTYIVFPTASSSPQIETLYNIGPYTCSTTLTLASTLNLLKEYISDTDDTLHAFINYLVINIHAATSSFNPIGAAAMPKTSSLPRGSTLLSNILNNAIPTKVYTPQQLQDDRNNLNTSWLATAAVDQPSLDYFNVATAQSGVLTTTDGWPDGIYLQLVSEHRLLAGFGTVDPQMSGYNFSADSATIFPPGYLEHSINATSTANGMIQSGCIYQSGSTNLSLVNDSWATTDSITDLPTSSSFSLNTSVSNLPSVTNITSCGISPLLNTSLANTTADINFLPYQAFAYSSIWSWAPGEPSNNSAISDFRCAVLDPTISGGRWNAVECSQSHRGACVSASSPYNWTLSSTSGQYNSRTIACPSGYSFSTPRTALENRHLLASVLASTSSATTGGTSTSTVSTTPQPVYINLNSLDVEFCWVIGDGTSCPHVAENASERITVPAVAGVIILIVALLWLLVKVRSNRQNSRRSRRGEDGWDYEGVPS